jgi:hypothetical protein
MSVHAYTPALSGSVDYEVIPDGTLRALDAVRERLGVVGAPQLGEEVVVAPALGSAAKRATATN